MKHAMVDTSHQPARGYMEVQRDAATLLPLIQAHVANGTIIHSDQWSAYLPVLGLPNVAAHETVNHSVMFVDPVAGIHTQNIGSYWRKAKRKLKRMKSCHASQFMWRERFSQTKADAFMNIMIHISERYPF